jgi:hypothetical protein
MVRLHEVHSQLIDQITHLFGLNYTLLDDHDWKAHIDQHMKERLHMELCGGIGVITCHPYAEYIVEIYHKYADFSIFVGDSMISIPTLVILCVMLNKRIDTELLFLIGAFLINLNPFYVIIVMMLWKIRRNKLHIPKQYRYDKMQPVCDNFRYTSQNFKEKSNLTSTTFDHILVGDNISTLYAAALLSRIGHSCCVLQPLDSPRYHVSYPYDLSY